MPPGRRSILDAITVKPFGPHQHFMRSGSVKAAKTRSRGASKLRVITNSSGFGEALVVGLLVVTVLLPRLRCTPRTKDGTAIRHEVRFFLRLSGRLDIAARRAVLDEAVEMLPDMGRLRRRIGERDRL